MGEEDDIQAVRRLLEGALGGGGVLRHDRVMTGERSQYTGDGNGKKRAELQRRFVLGLSKFGLLTVSCFDFYDTQGEEGRRCDVVRDSSLVPLCPREVTCV